MRASMGVPVSARGSSVSAVSRGRARVLPPWRRRTVWSALGLPQRRSENADHWGRAETRTFRRGSQTAPHRNRSCRSLRSIRLGIARGLAAAHRHSSPQIAYCAPPTCSISSGKVMSSERGALLDDKVVSPKSSAFGTPRVTLRTATCKGKLLDDCTSMLTPTSAPLSPAV